MMGLVVRYLLEQSAGREASMRSVEAMQLSIMIQSPTSKLVDEYRCKSHLVEGQLDVVSLKEDDALKCLCDSRLGNDIEG